MVDVQYEQAPEVARPERRPDRRTRAMVAAVLAVVALGAMAVTTSVTTSASAAAVTATASAAIRTTPTAGGSTGSGTTGSGTTGRGSTGSGSTGSGSGSTSTTGATSTLARGVADVTTVLGLEGAEAAGTGIVLSANGLVMTNNHVIAGATEIRVTIVSTGRSYTASVVGTDPTDDIAVLQLANATNLTLAHLGTSSTVKVADSVTAVGNAGGRGTLTSATGRVVALGQTVTATDESGGSPETLHQLIEVSAGLEPGDSGGPLYSSTGTVIGIDSIGSTAQGPYTASATSQGYAIPIDAALTIAKQIETGVATDTITIGTPGRLGVGIDTSTRSSTGGALVADVASGTPAATIGLAAGDVIVGIDATTITSPDALSRALAGHHQGDRIKVTWTGSNGSRHSATATLIAGPAN
jgi:S1-C subfamily serine protease